MTQASLLAEMVDRTQLAHWPEPAYTCAQASSYDRASIAPDQPGWFANWDRSHFVRTEEHDGRTEHVLMDQAGPGAIVRFWATWHGPGGGEFSNGTLRIYLDGAERPVIEGPMAAIIGGPQLAPEPYSYAVAPGTEAARQGHNLYLPIPYAQHCKVTYETEVLVAPQGADAEALYYQINYRTYAPDVRVQSYRTGSTPIPDWPEETSPTGELRELLPGLTLAPGETVQAPLDGPAVITAWNLSLDAGSQANEDRAQALRSTVIEWRFDGERTVWCPIGDFFGTGRDTEAFGTHFTSALGQSLEARWVMPFESNAELRIHNLGEDPVHLGAVNARLAPWTWDERSLHFHATWWELPGTPTWFGGTQAGEGAFDVRYVGVQGKGVYVGDSLAVFNPVAAWWGEGDEKIYVDGESFPSHFGTGTEDYYGYAWCRPESFAAPFHAQPTGAGNLEPGFSVNSRYRVLDAIPFRRSLAVDMELWHWVETKMNFAPTTFWYARPGASCNIAPEPDAARRAIARQAEDLVPIRRVAGALEGEALSVLRCTGGTYEVQVVAAFDWSGRQQLWWKDGQPGDRMELAFGLAPGRYELFVCLTRANDYGIVQLHFNGHPLGAPLDRYHPSVSHQELSLGTIEIQGPTQRLEIEIVGSHPEAIPKHMFGLDYLRAVAIN